MGFAAVNSSGWGEIWDWVFYGCLIAAGGAILAVIGFVAFKKCKERLQQSQGVTGPISESAR